VTSVIQQENWSFITSTEASDVATAAAIAARILEDGKQ
jgi:hypothetical protein